jgi:ubiquitin-like 1-activating enzyme E1 B
VEIFGISEDTAMELDETQDADNKDEIADLKKEQAELTHIRDSMGSEVFPRLVFDKVFKHDIDRLRSVEGFWDTRRPPDPLDFDKLSREAAEINGAEYARKDQTAWSVAENFAVFLDSIKRLSARMAELKAKGADTDIILTFDKDDDDTLDFVAASSNLRSHIFGIEMHSKFDIKQMAGNIIPAIATTNAIFAGLMVLHALKVMKGPESYSKAPMIFSPRSTDRVLSPENGLNKPNPDCVVCGVARTTVVVDPSRATMRHVVEDVLRGGLGYSKDFAITSGGELIYEPAPEDDEEEKDAEEVLLAKKLSDLGLTDGGAITVRDDSDEPKVDLEVRLSFKELPHTEKPAQTTETPHIPARLKKAPAPTELANGTANGTLGKRKRRADDTGEQGSGKKKGKVPADGVIVLDDNEVKPIEIDD